MATRLIGTPVSRVDGRLKVTGAAQYAAEMVLADMTFGVLMGSPIAAGRIKRIDSRAAEELPGVLAVITHTNRGRLGTPPKGLMEGGGTAEDRLVLEDNQITHVGQYVAFVVAETLEQARHAAGLVRIEYEPLPFAVDFADAKDRQYRPKVDGFGDPTSFSRGDVEAGFKSADVHIDVTYSTPIEHPCALEPHASIASWQNGSLTVYNATQWVSGDRKVLSCLFEVPEDQVRILSPFVGGMFGSKALTGGHTILAAIAARKIGRPVKVVLSREQVLTEVGPRAHTIQRMKVGAKRDGTLTALRHDITQHVALNEEFVESANISSRMLYKVDNYSTTHEAVRLNTVKPSWMRAPGETPGQYALECAMDELAYALEMDPVALRAKNHAEINLHSGKPFSSKHLLACYERGAERFGWGRRNPQPRSMRDGKSLLGWGTATATYPGYTFGSVVKICLERDGNDVRAVASTAGSDVGTGLYTILAMTVADELGLPLEKVKVELGDSELTQCAVAGGSNLTSSTAPAAAEACLELRKELLKLAAHAPDGFTGAEGKHDEFLFEDGRVAPKSDPARSIGYRELLGLRGEPLQSSGSTKPVFGQNDQFAFQSFGAHFVEVRVDEPIARVRVSRVVSVFDCGRIISAKTCRSQFIGGITFGIGMALLEELIFDRAHGKPVNADLAGYLVPVHADVPEIDISWIGEPDFNFNALGARGVGEIGITGVAAAVANAVYHATGVRVRDLPITPDKLLR